jgi:hypothetical protein
MNLPAKGRKCRHSIGAQAWDQYTPRPSPLMRQGKSATARIPEQLRDCIKPDGF